MVPRNSDDTIPGDGGQNAFDSIYTKKSDILIYDISKTSVRYPRHFNIKYIENFDAMSNTITPSP